MMMQSAMRQTVARDGEQPLGESSRFVRPGAVSTIRYQSNDIAEALVYDHYNKAVCLMHCAETLRGADCDVVVRDENDSTRRVVVSHNSGMFAGSLRVLTLDSAGCLTDYRLSERGDETWYTVFIRDSRDRLVSRHSHKKVQADGSVAHQYLEESVPHGTVVPMRR
jgi:hypothetical protein